MRTSKILIVLASILLVSTLTLAHEEGDFLIRFGTSNVGPTSDNGSIAALGVDLDVEDAWGVTFNGTYMLTDNWALELLAALPYEHEINLVGVGLVGETSHLPPTFSVQYHFLPEAKFQPYVGVGVNYTLFFDEGPEGVLAADSAGNDLEILDSSFGLAADLGADVMINDKWFVNFDFRYIQIDTMAEVTLDPSSAIVMGGATVREEVTIDPFVYGVHVGFRF